MNISLTQKERMLLEDQKTHEKVCVDKYNQYASQAQDPQLKQMFKTYASQEQRHYDTINQMLSGQVPAMNQQQQQGQSSQQNQQQAQQSGMQNQAQSNAGGLSDATLCTDMLMTEKYVSSAYNTAIFEFADANARQVLNHIQKEEQQHGEGIYKYLESKNMYQTS